MSIRANKAAVFAVLVCAAFGIAVRPAISQVLPKEKWPNVELREENFSKAWWLQASDGERFGFIYGIQECMTYHLKYNARVILDDNALDALIRSNMTEKDNSAEQFMEKKLYLKGPPKKPWDYTEPGGYEIWVNADDDGKRGIVEGYVVCSEHHNAKKLWFNAVEFYVRLLNILYDDEVYGQDSYSGTIGDLLDHYGYGPYDLQLLSRKDSYKTLPP